jgi:hypothetical protein
MIFSKTAAYNSKHLQKLACREVYAAEPATPAFLQWSRSLITFNRTDHLNNIPHLGKYPLMVNPIISKKWLTKVLMDGGTCLNIMSMASCRESKPNPLGRSTFPSPLEFHPIS